MNSNLAGGIDHIQITRYPDYLGRSSACRTVWRPHPGLNEDPRQRIGLPPCSMESRHCANTDAVRAPGSHTEFEQESDRMRNLRAIYNI